HIKGLILHTTRCSTTVTGALSLVRPPSIRMRGAKEGTSSVMPTPSTSKKKTYHSTTWDISLPVSTPRRAGQVHDHEEKKIILIAVLATVLTACTPQPVEVGETIDRKSTRLNSSHVSISYAVFCL